MSEEITEQPTFCVFCGNIGKTAKGWDENGETLYEPCQECEPKNQ